ncbi:MAG: 4Fe-4S dicluster domain-containing protein [bacterium]|nr:4Fe-4S dicluster domain-containing protein [bacterium]
MQEQAFIIEKDQLFSWLEKLQQEFLLIGPKKQEEGGGVAFLPIKSVQELDLNYTLTMMGPQIYLYPPEETICTVWRKDDGGFEVRMREEVPRQVLFAVRSCDLQAILVLDKVFLRPGLEDRNYRLWRENTLLIGLHCSSIHPQCFCASMGSGPFFEPRQGYDLLLTDLGQIGYLAETLGERASSLLAALKAQPATQTHFDQKRQIGHYLLTQFQKSIDTTHLVEVLLKNQDHPVWSQTADQRCLSCTNCTKVCPTCFCYNTKDTVSFDLVRCERTRYKDSCQELHFAQVHGANFRSTRSSRLRQFVTHKLATWVEQFGCFGCVGCGRCMSWCPTGIDLTQMAKEIMVSEGLYDRRRQT